MKEEITEDTLKELKNKNDRNRETEVVLNDGLLDIKIDGQEYKGLTTQEVAKRFGTNYFVMQNLRYLFGNEEIEQTIKEEQSVKDEVIEIFIKTLEENNVFEGKISIEEVRKRLEENLDSAYIINEGYEENLTGFWAYESRNLYILSQSNITPEQLKQAILNKDIEQLNDIDRLGVLCHEVLHALSTDPNNKCGLKKYDDKSGEIGRAINEGMTEVLAEQMVPSKYKTYNKEVETTKYLLALLGEDMIEAYLKSDFDAVLNMATEKQAETEFMKLITLSDYRLNSSYYKIYREKIDAQIDEARVEIINSIGSIDLDKFMEQNIPIPEGINSEIIIKATEEMLLNNYESEKEEEFKQLMQNYPISHLQIIDFKNNGEINFEEYVKSGIVDYNEHIIAEHFFEKGADFKTYCKNVTDSMNLLDEDNLQGQVGALLSFGTEINQEYSKNSIELTEFKRNIIEEIVYQDFGVYINTEASKEDYSWKDMISQIENFEYYSTDTGTFLVNSETGGILGVDKNGEIVNIEDDVTLQEMSSEEKNSNAIKYTFQDKESQIYLTEKNKDGKYILKGYTQDKEGKYIEIDVGLGRDFCDDTTELDRQIVSETSEIRSGNIKAVADKVKSDIMRAKEAEKGTVDKEEEEYEGR